MADLADRAARVIEREELDIQRRAQAPRAPANPDGLCRGCGDAIEPARLAVLPHAQRCADCQRAHERQQRHFRSA